MDLAALSARLDDLERDYQQRVEPLNRLIAGRLGQVNKPGGLTPAAFDRDIRLLSKQLGAGEGPLHDLLAELCPAYLEASEVGREAVRTIVQSHRSLPDRVRGYAVNLANLIRSPNDVELLTTALAAMSIENCAIDYRDTLLALAELWVRAERAGIDPRPQFESVAGSSSIEVPRGGSTPLAQILRDFHGYAVLPERRANP